MKFQKRTKNQLAVIYILLNTLSKITQRIE